MPRTAPPPYYWQNRQLEQAPGGRAQSAQDQEAAAQRAVADAEEALTQAQLALDTAQQAEVIGVQQAEADLRSARQDRATLQAGATDAESAAARAAVAAAQANLPRWNSPRRRRSRRSPRPAWLCWARTSPKRSSAVSVHISRGSEGILPS
ncbi:MAG: hypothetical protein HXY37_13220 [Chloroflexi bacterium]|nr:hypothetical protein [Chloroflexota bacterium]